MDSTSLKVPIERVVLPEGRIMVQLVPPETRTPGGIILPTDAQAERALATVLKVGPDGWTSDIVEVAPGDEVIIGRYSTRSSEASEIGENIALINDTDILAVVKPEN